MGLVVKVGADLSKFERDMSKATKDISYLGDKMSKAGSAMTKGLTLPIAGIATAAVATSTNFEKSMSNVAALSGATGDTFNDLREKAKELGASTQKSASEAADAMGYMALAGWDTNAMLTATEPILKLSVAGNMELAKCSDLVTDSMGSMGMTIDELDGYLDLLCKTQASANTSAEQLMEAYLVCGGTMKNLNVKMYESAAVIGVLANQGVEGSEAGTALNSVLINMTTGAGQAGKAMEELGLNCFDSKGKFKGMEVVLGELQGALSGMTEEQRSTYLAMIGGKTQVDTLNKLMQGMADGSLTELKEKLKDTTGTLDDMYGIMSDNTAGSIYEFTSAIEGLMIAIGEHLLPIFKQVVDKLTEWVGWFGELSPAGQKAVLITAALVAAIGPLITMIANVINIYKQFQVISGLIKAANIATTVSFMGVTLPIWAVIAAIAAVIAIGYLLISNWDTVKECCVNVWNGIKEVAVSIWGAISDFFVGLWNGIKDVAISVWGAISDFFSGLMEGIKNVFMFIWEAISSSVKQYWTNLLNSSSAIFGNIKEIISSILTNIKNVFSAIWNSVVTIVKASFDTIKNTISTVINGIKTVIQNVFGLIKGIFTGDLNLIKSSVSNIFGAIKNTISGIMDGAKNIVKGAIDKIKGFFNFKWELPKLKMPHFSVSGKFSLNPPSIPKFKIDWYSSGGIFMKPTVMGGIGVGDAINGRGNGPEAVLPLKKLPELLGLDSNGNNAPQQITTVVQLDGREIARATSNYIDTELRKNRDSRSRANGGM